MSTDRHDSQYYIDQLRDQLRDDSVLSALLVGSLSLAKERAEQDLDSDLYEELRSSYTNEAGEPVGWPTSTDDYLAYLTAYAQWLPQENLDPRVKAWNVPGTGYSQEMYDRLVHFYWLIDQSVVHGGQTLVLENYTATFDFPTWLDNYAKAWGSYLSQPGSLPAENLQSFKDNPSYRMQDYTDDEPSWDTIFNRFFSRELNPGLRPITDPKLNTTIVAPADCTYKAAYAIDGEGNIVDDQGEGVRVTLKQTHTIGSVRELLGDGVDDEIVDSFNNGTFMHFFLGPTDYHRFHAPVSGVVRVSKVVQGRAYLATSIEGGQFSAPDNSGDGYEFRQTRGVLVLDTSDATDPSQDIGYVAVAPIGMAQVSSANMTVSVNDRLEKGDEFGYFQFGGSDIILLFGAGATVQHYRYGQAIAYWWPNP